MPIEGMKDTVEVGVDVRLTKDQMDYAEKNPSGLTKEGVLAEIKNWKNSNNMYQLGMYEYMLKNCKEIKSSGKNLEGKDILARKDGKIIWVDK